MTNDPTIRCRPDARRNDYAFAASLLSLCLMFTAKAAEPASAVFPGTQPLTMEGDLAQGF